MCPAPYPGKTRGQHLGRGPASLPGGGVWLAQDPRWGPACPQPPASWPRFRPSAPLGGQPPSGCLLQVRSREGPPEAPSSPCPPSGPAQKQPHAPPTAPQPTSRSPRGTWPVPFMFPLRGDLPFHCCRQLLVRRPLKHGCGPACRPPPPRGVRGHFKGERTALPPSWSPEWGLSQAINAQASLTIVLIPLPEQVGPTPSPLPARLGAFFLLSLDV